MKTILIATASLAALGASIVYAQSQEPDSEKQAEKTPEPQLLKERLRAQAKRIPARNLAAALRASRDERDDRARTISGGPDLDALRDDLKRSDAEDAERAATSNDETSNQSFSAARRAPPPPPGIRRLAASRLKSTQKDEVARVRIPVLLPANPAIRDRIKVYGMENVYTATAKIDAEASLTISGTCNRVIGGDPDIVAFRKRLAEGPKRLAGTGASYQISRNDFGVDLSFAKFGCGYVMTIECGDPGADLRCTADDYISGLAESMILANPELAGGE
ncbi:hypothetical protein [Hyphococcus sp.]|uniref:hypothetical protein n=1 Tax=Hyphococcus sp. TaxID=2038636 RepID=UPI002084004F|nr:MAG: hypothetical protein DHS20C04_00420 [Marinicaulis sp.]